MGIFVLATVEDLVSNREYLLEVVLWDVSRDVQSCKRSSIFI